MWICTTKLWWWNVEKFLNKDPLPWVQLIWEKYYSHSLPESKLEGSSWWKSHLKLLVEYNKSSVCKLGNGQATLLWHDNWLDQPLKERFPELLSFAKSDSLYVHDWNRTEDQIQLFHTPLSTQAYNQFTQMQNLIQLQQNEHVKDTWTSNSQKSKYSSITMYHHLCQVANNSKNNRYINGCGRALVDWETKFSSGFYYMTEWTPGTCSKESISLWKVTPVYLPWRHGRNCETSIMGLWICSRLLPQYHSA